ncbi:hypothetical protein WMY93_032799 [Mugilogobius chulae]|uniref:Uncharacterized protein n=1 Tax=Mugilogobius chulae TaxID=88201 RepID=A0AAW0MN35_9GOBI
MRKEMGASRKSEERERKKKERSEKEGKRERGETARESRRREQERGQRERIRDERNREREKKKGERREKERGEIKRRKEESERRQSKRGEKERKRRERENKREERKQERGQRERETVSHRCKPKVTGRKRPTCPSGVRLVQVRALFPFAVPPGFVFTRVTAGSGTSPRPAALQIHPHGNVVLLGLLFPTAAALDRGNASPARQKKSKVFCSVGFVHSCHARTVGESITSAGGRPNGTSSGKINRQIWRRRHLAFEHRERKQTQISLKLLISIYTCDRPTLHSLPGPPRAHKPLDICIRPVSRSPSGAAILNAAGPQSSPCRLIAMQPTTLPITATQSHFHDLLGSACSRGVEIFQSLCPQSRGAE